MPVTRSLMEKKEPTQRMADYRSEPKAGEHNHCSVVGSRGSRKVSNVGSGSIIDGAKLRRESVRLELEREAAEFQHKQRMKLMEAEHAVRMAEMEASASHNDEESELADEVVDSNRKVADYLSQCMAEKAVVDDGIRSSAGRMTFNETPAKLLMSDLPKIELMSFDGSVCTYWKFFRQFETYVETRTSDEGQRFLYLLNYCRGVAREAIEECVMLPPEHAYRRARSILQDLFGQPHVVARSLLDGLFKEFETVSCNSQNLSHLVIKMSNCEIALKQMNYTAELNSLYVLERLVGNLPLYLQQQWAENVEQYTRVGREANFSDLLHFINLRARVANSRFGQLVEQNRKGKKATLCEPKRRPSVEKQHTFAQVHAGNSRKAENPLCSICEGAHKINSCAEFIGTDSEGRWEKAKLCRLCFNCLEPGHSKAECRYTYSCAVEGCKAHHHTLLHWERKLQPKVVDKKAVNTVHGGQVVALGILPIRLTGPNGHFDAYAFLDSGSDTTVICRDVVESLAIRLHDSNTELKTLNGSMSVRDVATDFTLASLDGVESIDVEKALVVDNIMPSAQLGPRSVLASRWSHLNDIVFEETACKRIAILVGCDIPEAHWAMEQRLGARKQPYAVKTLLGWVVLGPINPRTFQVSYMNCLTSGNAEIVSLLRQMYNMEFSDASDTEKALSLDDARVVDLMQKETRLVDGHYVVPLPWKQHLAAHSSNHQSAVSRLECLRKRLHRDPCLHDKYSRAMEQNLLKGYAREFRGEPRNGPAPVWYLPHHAVINPKKPEKIRVVFDCAARFRGVCLNDMLSQGPDMTASLVTVLLRFRLGRVAVAADIEEMFMQVRVPEADRKALKFLWWPSGDLRATPEEYEMVSHPFGATSSPYCANHALRKTVTDFGEHYDPVVSQIVLNNFYVDDCLASFDSQQVARKFVSQCTALLSQGGFRLRKWVSSEADVLEQVAETERAIPSVPVAVHGVPSQRALGILWDATSDVLAFQFDLPDRPLTRRGILSAVSSFYDPLGILSALCLTPKLLLQTLCKSGLGWDQTIGLDHERTWKEWLSLTKSLGVISIPRCMQPRHDYNSSERELHLFADASESGYGAVAYARYVAENTEPYCVILFAKSRVAPLKTVTIPRLELAAAVLAVQVGEKLKSALPDYFSLVRYWTDSRIVLHYLNDTTSRFATYVANRLATIHRYTSPNQWGHVRSNDNLADLASRGLKNRSELKRWLEGPKMIPRSPEEEYTCPPVPTELIEYKTVHAAVSNTVPNNGLSILINYHSSWTKLLRSIAWLKRFVEYLRLKSQKRSMAEALPTITVSELREAERIVIKFVQQEVFAVEIAQFGVNQSKKGTCHRRLAKLNPIIREGVLCVGGRLSYSSYPVSACNPVVLPSRHLVTDIIIRHVHELEGHCGMAHVQNVIRRKFWILQGSRAVKRVIGRCIQCRKRKAVSCQQMMSPLPLARIQQGLRCFESVGLDYFGPFPVKRGRSIEKRYGCVFTCLRVRAVHIEVAHSLTTDSFIMVLMRFISRRGRPLEIYSDNGTNFVGAIRELKEHIQRFDDHRISNRLAAQQIQWHFNPPSSSHRGGVWERMVRSIRTILNALANEQTLTDESLCTLMCEAERILNDRPLVPPSSDSRDDEPLTPNHLLLMGNDVGVPSEASLRDRYMRRWKQVNYLSGIFWHRWIREYLPTLQKRQKWLKPVRNLKQGDLVLIVSDQVPREKWPLGLIIECTNSDDGLVRKVTVRSSTGVVERDVRKLCLLEGAE